MKIRTIIIDDEIRSIEVLQHLLSKIVEIDVIATFTDPEKSIEQIDLLAPQLLLMDIQMPKLNAFNVLEKINYQNLKIIFITAFNEYAMKAFKYSAVDYLLKPVDETVFQEAIKKTIIEIEKNSIKTDIQTLMHNISFIKDPLTMKLCIHHIYGFSIINSSDIVYCESDSCYTIFHLSEGKQIISSKTMAEYEAILDPNIFLRIHRSYIINLSHIKEYKKANGGSVIMNNGSEVEISRRKKDEFINRIKKIFVDTL